jgi:hypothetical protein
MSWSNNNRAHTSLWFFEKWHLGQESSPFHPSGEWSTRFLIKSASGESVEMTNNKALAHAQLVDDAMTSLYRAKYEEGISQQNAIDSIYAVLKDPEKLLKDLGDPVDEAYHFLGET